MGLGSYNRNRLTGGQFEEFIVARAKKYQAVKLAHVKRYGVQATRRKNDFGNFEWQVIPSKPDFEGVYRGGYQFMFDCKVVSSASFPLAKYRDDVKGARRRQLTFMLERSEYGVKCFFLMHWNRRELAKRTEPSITWAFPIHPKIPFWREFLDGERRSITRSDCEEIGKLIPWNVTGMEKVAQPDFIAAL